MGEEGNINETGKEESVGMTEPAKEQSSTKIPEINQESIDRLVSEQVTKERAKLKKREEEVQRKEFLLNAREKLAKEKIPTELLEAMNTSNEEMFNKSIELLKQYMSPSGGTGSPGNFARPNLSSQRNPWAKEHFNLTEQGKLYKENPDLAKQLMAQAGEN